MAQVFQALGKLESINKKLKLMKNVLLILINLMLANVMLAQLPTIEKDKALEDLEEFQKILELESSYIHLANFDYKKEIETLKTKVQSSESISLLFLTNEMGKIVAKIGDRHSSVRYYDFEEDDFENAGLFFPYAIAVLNGKYVLLKRDSDRKTRTYLYFSDDYHFLKSINGIPVDKFMNQYFHKNKKAPKLSQLSRDAYDIRKIGEVFFFHGEFHHKEITLTLTDEKNNKTFTFPLEKEKTKWEDIGGIGRNHYLSAIEDNEYQSLDKWIKKEIGYIALPSMINYSKHPNFEQYLTQTIEKYRNSKAIIFDVRANGGGRRHITKTVSEYLIQPEQSPWVANVAHVRSDQNLDEDMASMQSKYLYNYNSEYLTEEDKIVIDEFNKTFQPISSFDKNKFSTPFYMILKSGKKPLTCPIYILMNERSFSAASIFASVFKGLPNVKLVGVTTDGSSGRSRYTFLKNSDIRIKISTMISFQRDGRPLDGYGTEPDIFIPRDEAQVKGLKDSQLEKLVEMIENQ